MNKNRGVFMKYLYSRKLATIGISAVILSGFIACSDESSSPNKADDTPVIDTPVLPPVTAVSPVVTNPMTVNFNGDGTRAVIAGGATLNLLDTTTIPAGAEVAFTSAELSMVKVTEAGATVGTPLQVTYTKPTGAIPNVNWSELGASIYDDNKTDCGTFRLYATYMASYDASQPQMYVSRDSLTFVRDERFCQVLVEDTATTPKEVPGSNVMMVMTTVEVGTKDGQGISLATLSAVPQASADLYFTADELTGILAAHSANGVQIAEYTNDKDKNWDDDWTALDLPPDPVTMSNFRFKEKSLSTTIPGFDGMKFYVATTSAYNSTTGDGFYAFTLLNKPDTPDANNNYNLTILIYKKQ